MASAPSLKDAMHNYLRRARAGMRAKVDGLSEYDRRRPMTATGTNLLGLVKHLTFYESYYLGGVFGRAPEWTLPWIEDDSVWQGADMWATPDETSAYLLGRYQAACAHADATIAALEWDAPATVPWWEETKRNTTLCVLLTHMIAETSQHLGHADIIREQIDGTAASDAAEMGDTDWWQAFHDKIQAAADTFCDQPS
jgi:uncharacterized damage-inducible protein DinB